MFSASSGSGQMRAQLDCRARRDARVEVLADPDIGCARPGRRRARSNSRSRAEHLPRDGAARELFLSSLVLNYGRRPPGARITILQRRSAHPRELWVDKPWPSYHSRWTFGLCSLPTASIGVPRKNGDSARVALADGSRRCRTRFGGSSPGLARSHHPIQLELHGLLGRRASAGCRRIRRGFVQACRAAGPTC